MELHIGVEFAKKMLLYDPKWHIPKSKFIEAAMRKVGLLARPIPAPHDGCFLRPLFRFLLPLKVRPYRKSLILSNRIQPLARKTVVA